MSLRARMRSLHLLPWLCLLALLVLPAASRAGDESAGTRAAAFLSTGVGPSVLAMGGAALASGRDVQGAAWNTAALGWVGAPQFALAHASFADQSSQEWAAYAGRLGTGPWRYGVAGLYRAEGDIEGRDAANHPTGALSAYGFALSLQLARVVGDHLSVGGAAHLVRQQIADAAGNGLAFDAGAQVHLGLMSFALAGQNFGGGMLWDGAHWRMPATFGGGIALEHPASGLRVALDYRRPADQTASVRSGAEWRIADRFALRAGYRAQLSAPATDTRSGPTFGLGAAAGAFWIDYGYLVDGDGTGEHRVGLSLRGFALMHAGAAAGTEDPATLPGPPAPKQ